MSNLVTVNSGSAIDGTLKAGRIAIATSASIDPSDFYEMINPAGGYVFITDPKVQGYNDGPPQIFQSPSTLPSDVLATINGLPDRRDSVPFDNVWDALSWVGHSGKYFILNNTSTRLFAGEPELVIDGASLSTYPQSGSIVFDLSGNDRNGTLINGTTWNENGYFEFDGTDDEIDFTEFQLTGDWTISYFYYHDESASNSMPLGTKDDNNSRFYHRDTGTSYRLRVHNAAGNSVGDLVIGNINGSGRQKWGHIAYSMTSARKYGWVNGQSNLDSPHSLSTTFDFNCIGDGYDSSEIYHWDGYLTQVVINNKKLTDQEVNQLYYGANIVTDGLVFATDAGNLVSYDKVGTTTYSLTGSASGSIINGVEYNSDFGGSWYFDGTNDYIDTNYSLNGSNAFSVECWFKLDRVDKNWQSIVDAYLNASDRNFQLWVNNNAKLYVFHLGPSHSGAGELFPNIWYHAVFTYEGSGNGVLYLDGEVLEASVPKGGGSGGNVNVDIGRRTDANASSYTDGNISKVKIYNRALTAAEVNQNYNSQYPQFKSSRDITKEDLVLELDAHNPDSYLSGTTWTDLSGNGNNGTLNNGVGYTTDNGGALVFDGTDDTVSLGNLGTIGNTQTISVWFNSSIVENYRNVLDMNYSTYSPNTGNTGPRLEQRTGGNLNWVWSGDTTDNNIYNTVTTGTIVSNTWYNAVFVQNSGNVSLYLNGVLANTSTSPNGYLTTYGDVIIGRGFVLDSSRYFAGKESSVKIWDRALSSAEVSNLYTSQAPRYRVQLPRSTTDSLKINLDAGDTTSYPRTGTTWYDRSGEGNNGTLTNGASYTFENGGKITLDGTNDYVLNTWKAPAGNKSMQFWVKYNSLDAAGGAGYSLTGAQQVNAYFYTGIQDGGQGYSYAGNTGGTYNYYFSASQWYNVATVMDNGVTRHYVDGEQVATRNYTTSNASTVNFPIGCVHNGSTYQHFFDADFATMSTYDRVLTPSEVLENYKSTRSRFGVDGIVTSNLRILYDFSNPNSFDNSSTTVTDLQGTLNGTLVNGMPFRPNNGGIVAFDGSNDYVDAGDPGFPDYTILMWFKIDTTQTTFSAVGHRTLVGCSNFRFQWDDNSTTQARGPFIDFNGGAGSVSGTTFSPQQWFNQWQQVGISRTNGSVKLFWNGVNINTGAIAGNDLADFEIGYDKLSGIGGVDPINRDGGEVQLGHFMVYDDVLTNDEVLQNYTALKNRFGKD